MTSKPQEPRYVTDLKRAAELIRNSVFDMTAHMVILLREFSRLMTSCERPLPKRS